VRRLASTDKRLKIIEPVRLGDPLRLHWDIGENYQYLMDIKYLPATQEIQFEFESRDNGWLALGFGKDMFNVDMLAFHSAGANSYLQDYFAVSHDQPKKDS